jgi:Protein of unknwon function (DUF3310)
MGRLVDYDSAYEVDFDSFFGSPTTGDETLVDDGGPYNEQAYADAVNSPDHYTVGGFEAIDVIKAKLTPEEYRGYLKGNCFKYLMRANYKGRHNEDCRKHAWYAEELAQHIDECETLPPEYSDE